MAEQQGEVRGAVRTSFDDETGIATLTMAREGAANLIDEPFARALGAAVDEVLDYEGLRAIVVASAHRDWCVGADIDMLFRLRDPERVMGFLGELNAGLRKLETCGVPVIAALDGSALGGGFELALSCHRRIAVDDDRLRFGLPEVTLGVIPGAGGTQRLPRLVGIQQGLDLVLQGRTLRPSKAIESHLIDETVDDVTSMRHVIERWVDEGIEPTQPWDRKRFEWPGPQPESQQGVELFLGATAQLYKKTAGAHPGPEAALRAVHEGAKLVFDRALEVESRHFARISTSDEAKDQIRTVWYHKQAAERGEGLPEVRDPGVTKAAILGAGMMGSGLAWIAAQAGIEVVVRDVSDEALDRGRAHCDEQAKKLAKRKGEGSSDPHGSANDVMERITWTTDAEPIRGADLVIEAIVENDEVKGKVIREVEPLLAEGSVFASNTSAIPIGHLAEASQAPERFIGLHFFSPVEKMPLLEVVVGPQTDEETVGRALGIGKALKKTPIVVNDGFGFYTSRVFASYILEAVQCVHEGHDPVLVERAAQVAGMAVPPLKVFDEVTLELGRHVMAGKERFTGRGPDLSGVKLLDAMIDEHGRNGKAAGAGFYDYQGKERWIWPGLRDLAAGTPAKTGLAYLHDRLLYAQCAEAGRALDEGVLQRYRDADLGSVLGLGFPAPKGGPLAWMDRRGLDRVIDDLNTLAEEAGPRFRPGRKIHEMAMRRDRFYEEV